MSRDRLIELIKQVKFTPFKDGGGLDVSVKHQLPDHAFEAIADHLLANGVIVLPCKVGQIVYEVQPMRARTQGYEITTAKWNGHYWWFTWVVNDRNGIYGNIDGFCCNQIGKTVFLTSEEAEKALKERS